MYARDPFRFVKMHFDAKKLDLYIYREYNTLRARNEDVFHVLYDELKLIDKEEQVIADSAKQEYLALNSVNCWKTLKASVPKVA